MIDRLAAALTRARADYTEIRVERLWSSSVTFRGRRLESATVSEDQGGFVRVLNRSHGWGMASFTSLDQLERMVARANELSRAVRLEQAVELAPVAPQRAEAILDLDGDVRGVPLAEKKRLVESYNESVARGWKSKSVEGQIESFASERRSSSKEHLTAEQIECQRQKESLLLSRKRVLHDIEQAQNPRHLKILQESLAYLDDKLAKLT